MFRLACLCGAALFLTACGGSSSETPFPLEPDLARLDAGPGAEPRWVVYTSEKKQQQKQDPEAAEESPPEPEQ